MRALVLLLCCACTAGISESDACAGATGTTCLNVQLRNGTFNGVIDSVQVSLSADGLHKTLIQPVSPPVAAPLAVGILLPAGGTITVAVGAVHGTSVAGYGKTIVAVAAGDHVRAQIPLDAYTAPSCTNELKDGNETDIDCGGEGCPACAQGESCASDTDCAMPLHCTGTPPVCE